MAEIFRTVHGSHLYGMAHENSDNDIFIVCSDARSKARHRQSESEDVTVLGWDLFLRIAAEGSHQSVEALFSPYKEWNFEFGYYIPLLNGMKVSGSEVFAKYERTIKNFCFGDFKRRRHAARLHWNLLDLRKQGRFNPRMSPDRVERASMLANSYQDEDLARILLEEK